MSKIRIELVIAMDNRIFMVYHSTRKCYQFSILDEDEVGLCLGFWGL